MRGSHDTQRRSFGVRQGRVSGYTPLVISYWDPHNGWKPVFETSQGNSVLLNRPPNAKRHGSFSVSNMVPKYSKMKKETTKTKQKTNKKQTNKNKQAFIPGGCVWMTAFLTNHQPFVHYSFSGQDLRKWHYKKCLVNNLGRNQWWGTIRWRFHWIITQSRNENRN